MKNVFRTILNITAVIALLGGVLVFAPSGVAVAQQTTQEAACEAINGTAGCTKKNADLNTLAATIINVLSLVVGVIAIIMIIVAGAKYIASGGEAGKVKQAKDALMYALIGLVVVALAQFMVRVVLAQAKKIG